jgi:virginiamycin B lyase
MERRINRLVELAAVTMLWVPGLLLSSAQAAQRPDLQFTYFPIPTPNSGSYHVTAGPDGNFWFTEQIGNKIARLTPDGNFTEFSIPTPFSFPSMITACPDGALWFTESLANQIGRITTTGTVTEFPVPTANSRPFGITCQLDRSDAHSEIFFTEANANQIGRMRYFPKHYEMTEFVIPTPNSTPGPITSGPDGNVWFTEFGAVGRITPSGIITEFPTPNPSIPFVITTGPDGNLWFTEYLTASGGDNVGRITPSGQITEFAIPTTTGLPFGITSGPDDELYFTEQSAAMAGRMTPNGLFDMWSLTPGTGPSGVATLATATPATGYVVVMEADANDVAMAHTDPPSIEFTKTASPDPVPVGGVLTYTLTVRNLSAVERSFYITDTVPHEVTVLPFQPEWNYSGLYLGIMVSDDFVLNPDEIKQIQLRVTADVPGPIANRAELTCNICPMFVSVASQAQ